MIIAVGRTLGAKPSQEHTAEVGRDSGDDSVQSFDPILFQAHVVLQYEDALTRLETTANLLEKAKVAQVVSDHSPARDI